MKVADAAALLLLSTTLVVAAVDDAAANAATTTTNTDGSSDTELSARTSTHHLSKLTTLSDGGPNPRVTCTDGLWEAANNIAAEMKRIGLVPLGDIERISFFNIVPGSINEEFCPRGMMNVIGMVPGTDPALSDEYVIFSAHIDGPNNQNPQTEEVRGNQDTNNVFDDALAVAFGLGLAEEMMSQSPPKRNVIFLFDDAEEGWGNIRTPQQVGVRPPTTDSLVSYWCFLNGKPYFDSVMWDMQGFEGFLGEEGACNTAVAVGFASWLREPTVDINDIKLIFNIDPLGITPGVSADALVLAVINGETSTSVDNEGTSISLNHIIDEALPPPPVSYQKVPQALISGNYNSAHALKGPKTYEPLCNAGNNCRADGGIPNIWIAATSFQKYHSGWIISAVKELFSLLSAQGLYQDESLPGTAYFSVDNMKSGNFDSDVLNALTTSLSDFIGNLFAREELSNLTFNKDNPLDESYTFNAEDLSNLIAAMELLVMQVDASAIDLEFYRQAPALLMSQLNELAGVPPETPIFQESIKQLGMDMVGLQLSFDTFNKNYAEKEAFLDQTVAGVVVSEAPDTGESDQGEDASSEAEGEGDQDDEDVASNSIDSASSAPTPTPPVTTNSASDPNSSATASHFILSGLGSAAAVATSALAFFSMM